MLQKMKNTPNEKEPVDVSFVGFPFLYISWQIFRNKIARKDKFRQGQVETLSRHATMIK